MSFTQFKTLEKLSRVLPALVIQKISNQIILVSDSNYSLFVLNVLKLHFNYQFSLLSSISGVDLLGHTYRFCVAYDLLSLTYNTRLRVKFFLGEVSTLQSSISVFMNANWWEREIWDLYGVYFSNHVDLRRILTDYGFEGHPLRKDFPLSGYIEVRYDERKKRVVTEALELTQNYRFFTLNTPW